MSDTPTPHQRSTKESRRAGRIAALVASLNRMERGLLELYLNNETYETISLETGVKHPEYVVKMIRLKYAAQGLKLPCRKTGPKSSQIQRLRILPKGRERA